MEDVVRAVARAMVLIRVAKAGEPETQTITATLAAR